MGVRLALDDFGAGFASFQHLTQLDFDEIKIDGEYVEDLAGDETQQVLVRSLAELAPGPRQGVTAEFVQDDARSSCCASTACAGARDSTSAGRARSRNWVWWPRRRSAPADAPA